MSKVVLMCGPAGSGKSTVAKRLEAGGMIRLSMDHEAWQRGVRSMPLPTELQEEIECDLRARLVDLVNRGVDVVVDFSFWSRSSRDAYRDLVLPFGIVPETIYVVTTRATALERLSKRAHQSSDDYHLAAETAESYFDHFEPPTEAGGPLTVVDGESHETPTGELRRGR